MSNKTYGISYMGSKSAIAESLCEYILYRHPDKKYFIDACCGGLAISDYVLQYSKLYIYANDLNYDLIDLYSCTLDELNDLKEKYCYTFVDRDTYFKLLEQKGAVRALLTCCWTYGNNNGKYTYLYGRDIEIQKELLQNLLVEGNENKLSAYFKIHENEQTNDLNIIREFYKTLPNYVKALDYRKNNYYTRVEFLSYWKDFTSKIATSESLDKCSKLQHLSQGERLVNLERLERLNELRIFRPERISFSNKDCIEFLNSLSDEIIENAIVYIDPPYKDTAQYGEGDENINERIRLWAIDHKNKCPVYVSEYSDYDGLQRTKCVIKASIMTTNKDGLRTMKTEKLLYNGYENVNESLEDMLGIWNN